MIPSIMTMSHDLPFDPTHGYTLETLLQVAAPAEPADLVSFWRETKALTDAVPTAVERRTIAPVADGQKLYEIEFDTLGGRCGGWLTVPMDGPPRALMVLGHGYGGRPEPGTFPQDPAMAVLSPCARGFHRSARPDVPSSGGAHAVHGIERRETYIQRFNVAEIWSAASVLLELFPSARGRLYYSGSSFGGGLGALALPWDERFTRAYLELPSLGLHPFRMTHPSKGVASALRGFQEGRPDVLPVLQYFDAAITARHITIPVLATCALFDPSVPPPGQFAVYNTLAGPKQLIVADAGHFQFPGLDEALAYTEEEVGAWFVEPPEPSMTAFAAVELLDSFAQAGIEVIVDGGWGVDALLGRQTRRHEDLDIAMFHRDVPALRRLLEAQGYRDVPRDDTRDCNFVLGNNAGHRVDVHSCTFDAAGKNVFGVAYVPSNFSGRGSILGRPVRCIPPADALSFRAGFPLRPKDHRDMRVLCSTFDLLLPANIAEIHS